MVVAELRVFRDAVHAKLLPFALQISRLLQNAKVVSRLRMWKCYKPMIDPSFSARMLNKFDGQLILPEAASVLGQALAGDHHW